MTVTRDATSLIYVPASAAEWTELLAGTGISNPSSLWLCQEASGSLADSIGSIPLGSAGARQDYQQTIAGWSRKGARSRGDEWFSTDASLPDVSTTSAMFFMWMKLEGTPAADSQTAVLGSFATAGQAVLTTGTRMQARNGNAGTTATGAVDPTGTVRPLLLQVNRATGNLIVKTDQEILTVAISGLSGKGVYINGGVLNVGSTVALYAVRWAGAAAELSTASLVTLFSRFTSGPVSPLTAARGPSIAATVAIDAEDGATIAYSFATDILRPISGKESRIALLGAPRERYGFAATLTDETIAQIQSAMVKDAAAGTAFAIGLSPESLRVSSDTAVRSWSKSPSVEVSRTTHADWTYAGQRCSIVSPDNSRQWNAVVQPGTTDVDYPWTLTKLAAGSYDAGASSVQVIAGDGYVEFVADGTVPVSRVMMGFSSSDPDVNYTSIQYGLQIDQTGVGSQITIYEGGVLKFTLAATNADGDVMRVQRVGTTITYWKNGTLIYTSATATSAQLMIDSTTLNAGARVRGIRLISNGTPVSLQWKNIVGCSLTGTGGVATGASPSTAADMASAVRWATWTNGWKMGSPVGGTLAPLYGALSLSQTGVSITAKPGPFGASSYAHGFSGQIDGGSAGWVAASSASLNPSATDDFAVAMIYKSPVLKDSEFVRVCVKSAFSAGTAYYQLALYGPAAAALGTSWQISDGVTGAFGAACKSFPGQWCATIAVVDRTRGISSVVTMNLETGEVSESTAINTSAMGALTSTGQFAIGTWQDSTIDRPLFQIECFHVSQGVKSARGMSENMTAAVRNFAECVFPHRIALDTLNDGYPLGIDAMRAAWGAGTWKSIYLCDDASTSIADRAGNSPVLPAVSSPLYSQSGPLGSGDSAVGFDSASDGFNAAASTTFDVNAAADIMVGIIAKHGSTPSGLLFGKYDGGTTTGYYGQHDGSGNLYWRLIVSGVAYDSILSGAATPTNEWYAALFILERATGKSVVGVINLATGDVFASTPTTVPASSLSNAQVFGLGASPWLAPSAPGSIAALMVGVGSGAATGTVSKVKAMLSNLRRYLMPPEGSRIMPAMPSYLEESQGASLFAVNAGKVSLGAVAAYFGDSNGAWTPKPAPHIVEYKPFNDSTIYPVWLQYQKVDGATPRMIIHGAELLDRGAALVNVGVAARSDLARQLAVTVGDDAARQYVKMFIGKVVGQQRAFLLPTWKPDLVPYDGDASTSTLKIRSSTFGGVDYASKWLSSDAHKVVMLVCANGSIVLRTITDAVDNLNGTQTLQLDNAVTGTTVTMISFAEKCRFDADTFAISWADGNRGSLNVPVRVVQR
jgi:hypothetical protein